MQNKQLHQSLQEKGEKVEALETRMQDLEGKFQRRKPWNAWEEGRQITNALEAWIQFIFHSWKQEAGKNLSSLYVIRRANEII